ncbi:hypothetical protein POJ06DRAFT_280873 [Lipomyces tetrasporus]|uniref:Zn(2)-C6 fungal-type domain-containing protein n=1 Tax=Lipomyces tetrasporus TaxID=54092 RepID=A0AAD7QSU6_9ASCO|nr:uncharacterized protein POJ06DRAFT_280873 [Lipomyces tetrasporus]KAJ8100849.1 hypothetical protein POJ06DRAFT_280873 [Lipomyces tetrasporus]
MVFCGRPSKGSSNCRARRIKCDQVEPSCSQCLRANKTCPGYRDQLVLLFREQSEEVARKVYRQRASCSRKANGATPVHEPLLNAPYLTNPSLEEEGIKFLLEHYLIIPSFTALDPSLMIFARQKYVSALRMTISSIQNSVQAGLDQTLRAVILLGIFEVTKSVTCDTSSMDSWARHFDGAAAILKVRDVSGALRIDGAINVLLIWFQIATGYIQRRRHLPVEMIEYPEWCREYLSELEQPACSLAGIVTKFTALWASVGHRMPASSNNIIRSALDLESDLKNWAMDIPESWVFNIAPLSGEVDDFAGNAEHAYPNAFIANAWSWYRTVRMLVNDLLVQHLSTCTYNDVDCSGRLSESRSILSDLSTEICSSASYFLKRFDILRDISRFYIHGAFSLLWPLSLGIRIALEMANRMTQNRQYIFFAIQ